MPQEIDEVFDNPIEKKRLKGLKFESDMARILVEKSKLPDELRKSMVIIDAPAEPVGERPNTMSTLQEWGKHLSIQEKFPKRILATPIHLLLNSIRP